MSREAVELIKRNYAALNRAYASGDFDAYEREIAPITDPEFVIATSGQFPDHGEWQGFEGALRFIRGQMEALDDLWIEEDRYVDVGQYVAMTGSFGGRAKETGIEISFPIVHVWVIRDARILRLQMARDLPTALEWAGLA